MCVYIYIYYLDQTKQIKEKSNISQLFMINEGKEKTALRKTLTIEFILIL